MPASGFVLLGTVVGMVKEHANGVLISIEMGALKICHRSQCEYGNPSLLAKAKFRDSAGKQ